METFTVDVMLLSRYFLSEDDDPNFWVVALNHILNGWRPREGDLLEIGCCTHWLRPHQTRWKADGGFAWTTGYGNGFPSWSHDGLPQFDWCVRLTWDGTDWLYPEAFKELDGRCPELRIALPNRTKRHKQAAVHTIWRSKKDLGRIFYGFRLKSDGWECTADSSSRAEKRRKNGRKPRSHRQLADKKPW